jgi:hypothetical protein
MTKFSLIVFSASVATVAAGGRLELKASDGNPCFIENGGASALQSSCDIIMPSTNSIKDELSAHKDELSALRDDICAIRLTHEIGGHNIDMANIVHHNSSGVSMKSSSDGKCKYRCANDHHAEDSGADYVADKCQPCRSPTAGEFTSTACSTLSNTVITPCDITGVGEVHTADCVQGTASAPGSNTGIRICDTKPSNSHYTTTGNCDFECDEDRGYKKSDDGASCFLTSYPTAFPTANPTANPTAFPTALPTANPTAFPTANPTAAPTCATFSFDIERGSYSTWSNTWGQNQNHNCPAGEALTGMWSYFKESSSGDDRRMKFSCGPLGTNIEHGAPGASIPIQGTGYTGFKNDWKRECPEDSYMSGVSSNFREDKDDRKFKFACTKFTNPDLSRTESDWTPWQNTPGQEKNQGAGQLSFDSEANSVITAIQSKFSDNKGDRKFSFKTSTFSGRSASC